MPSNVTLQKYATKIAYIMYNDVSCQADPSPYRKIQMAVPLPSVSILSFWGGAGNITLSFFDSAHTSWYVYLCMKAYRLTSGNIGTRSITKSKLPFSLL